MIRSLGFLGVRTDAFAATTALYRDVLELAPIHERRGTAWFRAADGAHIHVYDGTDEDGNVYEIIGPDGVAS